MNADTAYEITELEDRLYVETKHLQREEEEMLNLQDKLAQATVHAADLAATLSRREEELQAVRTLVDHWVEDQVLLASEPANQQKQSAEKGQELRAATQIQGAAFLRDEFIIDLESSDDEDADEAFYESSSRSNGDGKIGAKVEAEYGR